MGHHPGWLYHCQLYIQPGHLNVKLVRYPDASFKSQRRYLNSTPSKLLLRLQLQQSSSIWYFCQIIGAVWFILGIHYPVLFALCFLLPFPQWKMDPTSKRHVFPPDLPLRKVPIVDVAVFCLDGAPIISIPDDGGLSFVIVFRRTQPYLPTTIGILPPHCWLICLITTFFALRTTRAARRRHPYSFRTSGSDEGIRDVAIRRQHLTFLPTYCSYDWMLAARIIHDQR